MRRLARVLFSVVPAAAVVLLLVSPAASSPSLDHGGPSLPLSGPFPTHQWVRVWVPAVQWSGGQGETFSAGEARLRFRLDVDRCELREVDQVYLSPVNVGFSQDCSYEHQVTRIHAIHFQDTVNVDVRLPRPSQYPNWPTGQIDPPGGEPYPMLRLNRYGGNQVRVRIAGAEQDLFEDDAMGGAIGVFGPLGPRYPNYGAGGNPMVPSSSGWYSFDTFCEWVKAGPGTDPPSDAGFCLQTPSSSAGFKTSVEVHVAPATWRPDRNLQVYEVVGPDSCVGGEPYTWGVSLRNPEFVASEQYIAVIALLDAEGTLVRAWYSAPQGTPIGALGAASSLPVPDVRLGPGEHRLAVYARSIETDPDFMATAVETTIRCSFSPRVDPVREDLIPGQIPVPFAATATPQLRQPGIQVPRATATLQPRSSEIEQATPTPRLGRPDLDTVFSTPTPTPRLRLPDMERALPTPTPALRGPGTTIRAPVATPTPDEPDMRAPILR